MVDDIKPAALAPVIEANYTYGVNVVDIGDLRIARGMTRRPSSTCKHLHVVYDMKERRVWCKDCKTEIEPFEAFMQLVERYDHIDKRIALLRQIEADTIHSRAAKQIDKIFRSRDMTPCCPHCNRGILPEDVLAGLPKTSRDQETRRRSGR